MGRGDILLAGDLIQARPLAPPMAADSAQAADLAAALKRRLQGEVRFDRGSRALYATDLSIYRQPPIGVVIPRTIEDVLITVEACRQRGIPILGAGAAPAWRDRPATSRL